MSKRRNKKYSKELKIKAAEEFLAEKDYPHSKGSHHCPYVANIVHSF